MKPAVGIVVGAAGVVVGAVVRATGVVVGAEENTGVVVGTLGVAVGNSEVMVFVTVMVVVGSRVGGNEGGNEGGIEGGNEGGNEGGAEGPISIVKVSVLDGPAMIVRVATPTSTTPAALFTTPAWSGSLEDEPVAKAFATTLPLASLPLNVTRAF